MKCVAALIVLTACAGRAQETATISLDNGVELKIAADFGHPTGQENLTVQMARAGGNSVYRIFRDQNNLAVYAYQLVFDLSADGGAVLATAKPYDERFVSEFPYADSGKPAPTLSSDQALGPISSGHSADLSLFQIPGMGLDVSETLSVGIDHPSKGGALRFSDLQVSINGKTVPGAQQFPVSGKFLMFYIPGRGGYFFATENPGRGFLEAGTIDGDRMRFSVNNDDYECVTGGPVMTRPASGALWVYYDPNYKPAGNWTAHLQSESSPAAQQFFTAASDSLSWWLR